MYVCLEGYGRGTTEHRGGEAPHNVQVIHLPHCSSSKHRPDATLWKCPSLIVCHNPMDWSPSWTFPWGNYCPSSLCLSKWLCRKYWFTVRTLAQTDLHIVLFPSTSHHRAIKIKVILWGRRWIEKALHKKRGKNVDGFRKSENWWGNSKVWRLGCQPTSCRGKCSMFACFSNPKTFSSLFCRTGNVCISLHQRLSGIYRVNTLRGDNT